LAEAVPAIALRFANHDPETRGLASAALIDFDTAAVHEIADTEWRVFFRDASTRDRALDALAAMLGPSAALRAEDVPDEDWARRSQASLRAIAVGDLVIAPPWDVPAARGQRPGTRDRRPKGGGRLRPLTSGLRPLIIVIEPSTGFGTGHHATTRLCLRALQRVPLEGLRVIDVGTGSGVLAIAAARLGASRVIAVDHDRDALEAARANVARNGVRVDLRLARLEQIGSLRADVVVANLTGAVLQAQAAALARLARGGTLILSGLLAEEATAVSEACAPFAASELSCDEEEGWAALVMRARSD
jgi:ribosomal protein L11 methyltransferase